MRTLITTLAALVLGSSAANAQVTQLTFEGLMHAAPLGNAYAGGAGGDLGVSFTQHAISVISVEGGGSGNFQQTPSGVTGMGIITESEQPASATMNVANGFQSALSFYYSAPMYPGTVRLYSGLNGSGLLLGFLDLPTVPPQPGTPECPLLTRPFCPWVPVAIDFGGTAQSVVFDVRSSQMGFDNITLGSGDPRTITPPTITPEPSTWLMLGSGLLGLAGVQLRRRRSGA